MIQLPLNCSVQYDDQFLSQKESTALYQKLKLCIATAPQKIDLPNGEHILLEAPKTQFALPEFIATEKMHKAQGEIQVMFPELERIKQKLETLTQRRLDVCVAIYYSSGAVGVDYHSDLSAFGDTSCIPSISLGATRTFSLRENINHANSYDLELVHGSLVIMGENCQEHYEHAILADPSIQEDRINLTFRTFGGLN
ncbi:MAG: DNA repair protein [Crocinitomicaceae bacterium]|nr:DNA repair protein [Crocinitomicaceae bacterium]|tara:strand:+ start:1596 stop:2186 length:591 start_codon:yes stop_codon:yes gene_type:complete